MSTPSSSSATSPNPASQPNSSDRGQAKGRGRSRGGQGKYLRARGRRGYGRPAEFKKRLLLEGEAPPEDDEEAAQIAAENARKYSRRQLTTNADRYEELEPELGSDGKPIVEPEVDLSAFLEKQKLSSDEALGSSFLPTKEEIDDDDNDIDHDIAPLDAQKGKAVSKKGKVEQIEWTPELEAMRREKAAADAARSLKERVRKNAEAPRTRLTAYQRKVGSSLVNAPPLPLPEGAPPPESKDPMKEMEDFLDELLNDR